jgi:hypothetical protein
MNKIKNQLIPLILSVLILSFLTAYWIFAWDEPSLAPPLGNVANPINIGSTSQTKSGALTVSTLTTSGGVLYLDDLTEGNIERVNAIIGYDDLFLKGDSLEASAIHIAGSQVSSYTGGIERMKIDSLGDIYITGLIGCDTIDSDASGKLVCGTDETGVAGIQGGGTVNYLSKFTDTGTIGNSQVFDDGASVGIGTAIPGYKLDVAGPANLNDGIASGVALYVNTTETIWYNGTYFSWGYGGTANYFSDPIGIGDTTPDYTLDVAGSVGLDGDLTVSGGDVFIGNSKVWYYAAGDAVALSSGDNAYFQDSGIVTLGKGDLSQYIQLRGSNLQTSGTNQVNLAITGDLTVSGNNIAFTNAHDRCTIDMWSSGDGGHCIGSASFENHYGPNSLYSSTVIHKFHTYQDEVALQIGDIGGSGAQSGRLNVTVGGNLTISGKYYGDGSELTGISTGKWSDCTGGICYSGGDVGIGTTAPGSKLDIADAATAAGAQFLRVGDDSFLTDIDVANTLGVYGVQDSTQGKIKLGSAGPTLSGASGNLTLSGNLTVSGTGTSIFSGTASVNAAIIRGSAAAGVDGEVHLGAAGDVLRVQTESGWVDIGPANTSWAHISTDRASFYFGDPIAVNGILRSYNDGYFNLGNSSTGRWGTIYGQNLNISVDATISGDLTVNGTLSLPVGTGLNRLSWTGGGMRRMTDQGGFSMYSDSSVIMHAGDNGLSLITDLGIVAGTTAENFYVTSDGSVYVITNRQTDYASSKTFTFNISGDLTIPGKYYGDGSELTGISAGKWSDCTGGICYSGGNVGIGTTAPAQKLEIGNGGYVILHEGFWGSATSDPEDVDIWGISSSFYPSHVTAGSQYGIKWDNIDDRITFVGAGITRAYIDINDGNTYIGGDLTVSGGDLTLNNGTSNRIAFSTVGVAAPGAGSAGAKIILYGANPMGASDYVIGIESSTMWFNTNVQYKWYEDSALRMTLGTGGNLTLVGNLTVQDNIYVNNPDYGQGLVGRYDSYKYRLVYSMGSAYMLTADGTGAGNLYGLAYTYPRAGLPQAISGLGHQLVLMANGVTTAAMGTGIWTSGDLTVGGGDIIGKNGEWIDIGEAQADSVQISNSLIIGANDYIDDDTTLGGNADDWIKLSGYIELHSNTDNYGIVLRDKDTSSYLALTQVGGYSYLTDSSTYGNYFLRGNGADAHVRGKITMGATFPNRTSHLVCAGCQWIVPRGLYNLIKGPGFQFWLWTGSGWTLSGYDMSDGTYYFDGSKQSIKNTNGYAAYIYYQVIN